MSHTEKKGLSPKFVIHKSGYHAVKSPLSQKKKKPSYPDQFIILNSDMAKRKFEFCDETNVSIEPQRTSEYCYFLYENVKKQATEIIQDYFRGYFERHPRKVNRSVQPKRPQSSKRVVLELH